MTDPLRIDIPLLLPDVVDAADRCVERLLSELSGREGVERVHVVSATESGPAQLCIHFDQSMLSLQRIRQLVEAAGAKIAEQFGHAAWTIEVAHARRARTLADLLRTIPGVLEANVSASGAARIEFDRSATSEEQIKRELERRSSAGEPVQVEVEDDGHGHVPGKHAEAEAGHAHGEGGFWSGTEIRFALACGTLLLLGFMAERFLAVPKWVPLAAYMVAYVFGGWFTLREAIDNLRLKRFEIDTLMLVAAAGAAALGAWAEGALLLFLFSFGHALEHYAMGRAKRAIEALAELTPRVATVRRGEEFVEIPVGDLALGDIVVVKPNSRLAADGSVVTGDSSIDQAPVTGDSMPVD